MKFIVKKLYQFHELSEELKKKVLDKQFYINAQHGWWELVYGTFQDLGVNIKTFELGRAQQIEIEIEDSEIVTAQKIIESWGEDAEGFKEAKKFISDRKALVAKFSDGVKTDIVAEGKEEEFDTECDELEGKFREELKRICLHDLQQDFDYRFTEEAIVDTITLNEYYFNENGDIETPPKENSTYIEDVKNAFRSLESTDIKPTLKSVKTHTEQGNVLIADFMGLHLLDENQPRLIENTYHYSDLEYHSSWNWLIPVVQTCKDNQLFGLQTKIDNIDNALSCDCTLKNVYETVIDFINEYNRIKNQ